MGIARILQALASHAADAKPVLDAWAPNWLLCLRIRKRKCQDVTFPLGRDFDVGGNTPGIPVWMFWDFSLRNTAFHLSVSASLCPGTLRKPHTKFSLFAQVCVLVGWALQFQVVGKKAKEKQYFLACGNHMECKIQCP